MILVNLLILINSVSTRFVQDKIIKPITLLFLAKQIVAVIVIIFKEQNQLIEYL